MLRFHGIRLKNSVPERYDVQYNLQESLRIVLDLIDKSAGNSFKVVEAINHKINSIYQSKRAEGLERGQLRYKVAKWQRAKDIFNFLMANPKTAALKIEIARALRKPIPIEDKWAHIELHMLLNADDLNFVDAEIQLSDPDSEINQIIKMVVLLFIQQDEELPPPNLYLEFIFNNFPRVKWLNNNNCGETVEGLWLPKNPYCRHNFLTTKLIKLSQQCFGLAVAKLEETKQSAIITNEPIIITEPEPVKELVKTGNEIRIPLEQRPPSEMKIDYKPLEDDNSYQLALIQEKPHESLNSFQRMIQKKYSHSGTKHFLAVMRQLGMTAPGEICGFRVQKHMELVTKVPKSGRVSAKQLGILYSVLEDMQRLLVTRGWDSDTGKKIRQNSFIMEIGRENDEDASNVTIDNVHGNRLPMLKLLLDPIFYPSKENAFRLGQVLSLIPEAVFRESIKNHALIPGLSSYFYGTWLNEFSQANGVIEKTAEEIFEGCAFNIAKSSKYRMIHKLKSELTYMEGKKYISQFELIRSREKNPWKDRYRIFAPKPMIRKMEKMLLKHESVNHFQLAN